MLTQEQEKWLSTLNNKDSIRIIPFDINSYKIFEDVKTEIQNNLGKNIVVEHHGASSLGISGQDEIDIYIPVFLEEFDNIVGKISLLYGNPRKIGKNKRVCFRFIYQNKKIDFFVVNKEHKERINHMKLKQYFLSNPKILEEYKLLKEKLAGKSTREYYKAKLEFINSVQEKIND